MLEKLDAFYCIFDRSRQFQGYTTDMYCYIYSSQSHSKELLATIVIGYDDHNIYYIWQTMHLYAICSGMLNLAYYVFNTPEKSPNYSDIK